MNNNNINEFIEMVEELDLLDRLQDVEHLGSEATAATINSQGVLKVSERFFTQGADGTVVITTHGLPLAPSEVVERISRFTSSVNKALTIFEGGLLLNGSRKLRELPARAIVHGPCSLRGSSIRMLPYEFTATEYLDISDSDVEMLPASVCVGGNCNLGGTKVVEIPRGWRIKGNLILGAHVSKVASDLKVDGYIVCSVKQAKMLAMMGLISDGAPTNKDEVRYMASLARHNRHMGDLVVCGKNGSLVFRAAA